MSRVVRAFLGVALCAAVLVAPAVPASAHGTCKVSAGHYAYVDPYAGLIWQAWGKMKCQYTHYQYLGEVKLQYKSPQDGWVTLKDTGDKIGCCNQTSAEFDTQGL